jgi:hypothetical protein
LVRTNVAFGAVCTTVRFVTVSAAAMFGTPTASAATPMAVHKAALFDMFALHASRPPRRDPIR